MGSFCGLGYFSHFAKNILYEQSISPGFEVFPKRRMFKGMFKGTQLIKCFPFTSPKGILLHSITVRFVFYMLTNVLRKQAKI